MTQNQPDGLDNVEAALGRFAELTIQNIQRYDEALFRIEGAIADLTLLGNNRPRVVLTHSRRPLLKYCK